MEDAAKQVADALIHEFKFFKELAEYQDCDVVALVRDHMKMTRTFEVKKLTQEVRALRCANLLE